jgi:O-antigen ligase
VAKKKAKGKKKASSAPTAKPPAPSPDPAMPFTRKEVFPLLIGVGVALLALFRLPIDGIVYPQFNNAFVWGFGLLFALWAASVVLRKSPIRFKAPMALLAGFVLVAFLTSFFAIQADFTMRSLPLWATNFFIFALACNALTTRRSQAIVLWTVLASLTLEALFSIVHLHYILPLARVAINETPSLVQETFNATEVTPDIKHRMESDRAFGSLLFPNALAALMLLGIPCAVGAWADSWKAWKISARQGGFKPLSHNLTARQKLEFKGAPSPVMLGSLVIGLLAWFAVLVVAFFISVIVVPATPSSNETARWIVCIFLSSPAGLAPLILIRRYGFMPAGLILQAWIAPAIAVLAFYVLRLTGSRGGLVGLLLAITLMLAVMYGKRFAPFLRRSATAILILIALSAPVIALDAYSQAPPSQQLLEEGGADSEISIFNTNTLLMRFDYWSVGWRMIKDHPLTGVGLDNYENAYGHYQQPGEFFSKEAHNDYLQAFCETGVFGGLLFTGFWIYFVLWGARIIQSAKEDRWLLVGLYGSVLAFLVHQMLDFSFQNPNLSAITFLMAGLFYARAQMTFPKNTASSAQQVAAVIMLVALAATVGSATRVARAEATLEATQGRESYRAGAFLLAQSQTPLPNPNYRHSIEAPSLLALVTSSTDLDSMGFFEVPNPADPRKRIRIPAGGSIPRDATFVVTNTRQAKALGFAWGPRKIEELEALDATYPHTIEPALNLFFWYELLWKTSANQNREVRREYADKCLYWARACAQRNTLDGSHQMQIGKALWYRGNTFMGAPAIPDLEAALEAFKKAAEMFPSSPEIWETYADRLLIYSRFNGLNGFDDQVPIYEEKAAEVSKLARKVRAAQQSM